jgi:cobalt/nickel transport system permease protein
LSGGRAHGLYVHAHSRVHALRPQCKVLAAVAFVVAIVATPREALWAFAAYGLALVCVALVARIPVTYVLRRMLIEIPFLLFALALPLLSSGERIDVLGVQLSVEGLWAAWNIVAKASLGVATTILLAATTQVSEILHGLERLHVPRAFTSIAHFMVRYGDVVTGEMRRMKIARESRGYDARWLWQARAIAASLGALFVRSFERGERVHLAMVSRGYDGSMPLLGSGAAGAGEWMVALTLPITAAAVAAAAWMVA